jgi:uncharacterized membrane protein YfcA
VDFTILVTVGVAFLCGGVIKGMIGIGLPLTAIALMTQILDLRVAIPLLVIPVVVTNIVQAVRGPRFFELLKEYWVLLTTTCLSTFTGVYILYRVDVGYLQATLGVIVAIYALINLLAIRVTVQNSARLYLSPLLGIGTGILAGTTGTIGVPLVIYFQALGLTKGIFVQAIGIQFMIAGSFLTLALWREGGITMGNMPISAAAMVPALIGMYLGERLRNRFSEDRFRNGVFVFLFLVGLNLVRKGLL